MDAVESLSKDERVTVGGLLDDSMLSEEGKQFTDHYFDFETGAFLQDYVARNWEVIRHSAGAYTLEGEGARLFLQVRGDFFTVLGLPLLPLLDHLVIRGEIAA